MNIFRKSVMKKEEVRKLFLKSQFDQRRHILEQNILFCSQKGISDSLYCDHQIIVSLTTYGKRIYDVHLTIESIMEQTILPNKIVLWLDYSFENKDLPKALSLLQSKGLEIRYCNDIRSYKKLIPSLLAYPNDAIITIDDDVIYEFDFLERMIMEYLREPSYIYCHRYHRMKFDKKGNLLPYCKWDRVSDDLTPSILNFPTGVGGVLYPPHSLDEEVLNESVFMGICQYADDVWFKAMSLKSSVKIKKVFSHNKYSEDFILNPNVQDISLQNINVDNGMNDKQIQAVFTRYNLYPLLNKLK